MAALQLARTDAVNTNRKPATDPCERDVSCRPHRLSFSSPSPSTSDARTSPSLTQFLSTHILQYALQHMLRDLRHIQPFRLPLYPPRVFTITWPCPARGLPQCTYHRRPDMTAPTSIRALVTSSSTSTMTQMAALSLSNDSALETYRIKGSLPLTGLVQVDVRLNDVLQTISRLSNASSLYLWITPIRRARRSKFLHATSFRLIKQRPRKRKTSFLTVSNEISTTKAN